jgi:hypothetical protein
LSQSWESTSCLNQDHPMYVYPGGIRSHDPLAPI